MIDKKIFQIAANTENFGFLDNHTHQSSSKNRLCGDDIKIYLKIKEGTIIKLKYEGKNCIYCQASASLLSKYVQNKSIKKMKKLIMDVEKLFVSNNSDCNDDWNTFKKIMNKKNIARKDCLILPLKTLLKAINN